VSNPSIANPFQKANRLQLKARVAVAGTAKAGKSLTSLILAHELANSHGGNGRIAAIDTEFRSLSKYANLTVGGRKFDFDVIEIKDFAPLRFQRLIEDAGKLGYDALVIDSLSHAWMGKGGALDQVDAKGGNSFTAWKDITPQHRAMIDAILASPLHVIATMRLKSEYILEEQTNKSGKTVQVPKKVGLGVQQRDGVDYEFDMVCRIDESHTLIVEGSRCGGMDGRKMAKPDAKFFQPYIDWLGEGDPDARKYEPATNGHTTAEFVPASQAAAETSANAGNDQSSQFRDRFVAACVAGDLLLQIKLLKDELGINADGWKSILAKRGVETAKSLTPEQQQELIDKLNLKLAKESLLGESAAELKREQDAAIKESIDDSKSNHAGNGHAGGNSQPKVKAVARKAS
jgi:hypothetical protein